MPAVRLDHGHILDALPFGVVVVASDQTVLGANATARELLPDLVAGGTLRCHELLQCGAQGAVCAHGCLAMRSASSGTSLPEIRIDIMRANAPGALWVTAAPLATPRGAILHLRPGHPKDRRRRSEPHWLGGPELRIQTLGRTSVESGASALSGRWLSERPGQILKYLVCHRSVGATTDAIAEAIWRENALRASGSVRHAIHRLRDNLEPDRTGHGRSSFVLATARGYALDRRNIWIDIDEFEASVEAGMASLRGADTAAATRHLTRADELYVGEFLADEPYADWALDERRRLHVLAVCAMRALAILAYERNDHAAALGHLERLCALEPYDEPAHRDLITALFAAGRLSDARRRYKAFGQRIQHEFRKAPDFDLKSLRTSQRHPHRSSERGN